MARLVVPERTGWRDSEMSERHRLWGFDCPAIDVDFFMVEYNRGEPVALVDYKHHKAQAQHCNPSHPSFRAMRKLANNSGIPAWIAYYWPDTWTFVVKPLNERAAEVLGARANLPMTERQYVLMLYRVRHNVATKPLIDSLNDELSPAVGSPF